METFNQLTQDGARRRSSSEAGAQLLKIDATQDRGRILTDREVESAQPVERVLQAVQSGHRVNLLTADGRLWYRVHRRRVVGEVEWFFTDNQLPERLIQVASGAWFEVVVTESGQLWVCGDNEEGQLGLGDNERRYRFTYVDLPEAVKQVVTGEYHTALLTESGQSWVCGDNYEGQLGLGDYKNRNVFTRVELPEPVKQISAGDYHTVFTTESDRLLVYGDNHEEIA